MNISKGSLISEFSLKSFYVGMDLCNDYITQQLYSIKHKKESLDIESMIKDICDFDEKRMISHGKEIIRNYIPMNNKLIFQHIDKSTNYINEYDAEKETFNRYGVVPSGRDGFVFLPYSRGINFCGGLFVTGGFEENTLGNTAWLIEKTDNLNEDEYFSTSPFTSTHSSLISKIPTKNTYTDKSTGYNISQLCNMIYPRGGHTLVGLVPNLIIAIGGINNNITCEAYIVDENKWEEIAPIQQSRIDANVFIYNNYIYLFGGLYYNTQSLQYQYLNSFERLSLINPQKNAWEYVFPKYNNCEMDSIMKTNCGILAKNESTVYIIGGQQGHDLYSDDIIELNMENLMITLIKDKKIPKRTSFLEKNFIYLYKLGFCFDFEGDVIMYNSYNDTFSLQLQKQYGE